VGLTIYFPPRIYRFKLSLWRWEKEECNIKHNKVRDYSRTKTEGQDKDSLKTKNEGQDEGLNHDSH